MHRDIKLKVISGSDDNLIKEGKENTDTVDAVNEKEIQNKYMERKIKDLEETLAIKQIAIKELREAETELKVANSSLKQTELQPTC